MALHKTLLGDELHGVVAFTYADAAARTGATGLVSTDVGKIAKQSDDGSFWILTNHSPVSWVALTGASAGMTAEQHKALRQLIHFIDNGPAESFASGAYREMTGTVFPTAIIWYDKAGAGKKKIVEKLLSYTGAFPITATWKVYDASETLLATVIDTISYSGAFETSRLRSIA
jgi:hypothetical protein